MFDDTVSALVYAIAGPHAAENQPGLLPPYNDVTQFVLEQHARLPAWMRKALKAATIGFDFASLPRAGSRFHKLAPEIRRRRIQAWKGSPLSFQRDLIRYFESLSLFGVFGRASTSDRPPASPTVISPNIVNTPGPTLHSEIIVIGSGPGGAITAALLAEAGREVLLVEEGPYLGLDSCTPFSRDEMVQKYRNGGQTVALGANKISYVEGRCVGGGSEINSGLYHRTPPEILERWRKEFAVDAIGEKEMQLHFEACERDLSVSLLPGAAPLASLKLHEGASRLGWKSMEVPRWFRYAPEGGRRQSMTETFVPRFLKAGGNLLPRAAVENIQREGASWTIHARHETAGPIQLTAKYLFLCAGAVQTPAILRRSGITRNVGNSLQLHPTVKVTARFKEAVNSAEMGVPVHQVKQFSPLLSFGCSISSPPYLALGLLDHPPALLTMPADWPHLATYYAMLAGDGSGTIRTPPGMRTPLVRYRLPESGRRDLADGLRNLCRALFESGATTLYPGITGLAPLESQEHLSTIPGAIPPGRSNLMTIHLFSSCPMGENRDRCAADSFGRVHGFESLFVSDASLLCTAPGVNPQGSIMALARRNAMHFLEQG
jgi:hypothetical protein